jgi:Bacteriophage head to tail connecting protein
MAYDLYVGQPEDEAAKTAYLLQLFSQARLERVNFDVQWEESAALAWPEYRNTFSFGHVRAPGVKYTQLQVDSSASIASHRFMAICDGLITPHDMMWSYIRSPDKELMKDRDAKNYYGQFSQLLWAHRYTPDANFAGQQQQNWQALGVFGNMAMFTDEFDMKPGGFNIGVRYMSCPPGGLYPLQNWQGRVDGMIWHVRYTPREAYSRWGEKIPQVLMNALRLNSQTRYDFLQFVLPRTDYDPYAFFSAKGKRWWSPVLCITSNSIIEEGGFRTFPFAYGRYLQAPEEWLGRGWVQQVLPELKTLNAEKAAYLKQGHMAGDPAYLIGDDGLTDFRVHAGARNMGGMTKDGKLLIGIVPPGQIQVTLEMMQLASKAIDDASLVSLFPFLFRKAGESAPGVRTAREVIEVSSEKALFLAPTLGRQYTEYCSPLISREIDILSWLRLLPPMPGIVAEAHGRDRIVYEPVYSSPLARAMRGQRIAGYMRTREMANAVVQAGGDPSINDIFEDDEAIVGIADDQFVPPEWLASPQSLAKKRKARADAQQRDEQLKALPGQAAIMKAKAISDKAEAGQNIGGTLSGTPQGGMPYGAGNPNPGTSGMPGSPGQPGTPGQPPEGG